jgi:hypothetical protein
MQNVLFLILVLATIFLPLAAQTVGHAPPAPVPPQIAAAKKVFISNLGGDSFNGFIFSRDRDYVYNEFYAGIKALGKCELVSSPSEADLVISIAQTIESTEARVMKGDSVGLGYEPQLKLTLVEPKTHIVLWSFLEHVPVALLKSNRDKNLDQSLTKIIEDAKSLLVPNPK